jgi:parallel beta-helix repeat protein
VAVLVGRWAEGTTGSARIIGNVIENYQKNGPTIDNIGSHAEIAHNRILGVGSTSTIAQNGIQTSRGATAEIRHNFVSQNIFSPGTVASTGILFFGSGSVVTDHNTISANDVGVFMDNNATPPLGPGCGTPEGSSIELNRVRASTFDGTALAGLAPCMVTNVRVAQNKSDHNEGPGIAVYDGSHDNAVDDNMVESNEDSGVLLDDGDNNTVGNNKVRNNGTADGDMTDGIRLNVSSMGNTVHDNHLRDNVTHDCHDNSIGTANTWVGNHGETSMPPGLCGRETDDAAFETATVFGWDPNYPWYTLFDVAADYDWATAYATIDIESLLQLLPAIRISGVRRPIMSPSE